jgi:hypothetical protein
MACLLFADGQKWVINRLQRVSITRLTPEK